MSEEKRVETLDAVGLLRLARQAQGAVYEVNHFFQTARTGEPTEIAELDETLSPRVLALLSDWLRRQAGLAD